MAFLQKIALLAFMVRLLQKASLMGLAIFAIIHGLINKLEFLFLIKISNECSISNNLTACENTCPSTRVLIDN